MIITNDNSYTVASKNFFLPWQKTNISYDALLGISITLGAGVQGSIFLSTYIKTQSKLTIGFDLHTVENDNTIIYPIIREDINLNKGMTLIQVKPRLPYMLSATLTVIDTNTVESYNEQPIQISPMFIKTSSISSTKTIKLDNIINIDTIDLTNCELTVDGFNVDIDSNNMVITFDNTVEDINIVNPEIGLTSFGGYSVEDGIITWEIGDIPLHERITTKSIPGEIEDPDIPNVGSFVFVDMFAPSPCDKNKIYEDLFSPNNHTNTAPIDVCFTNPHKVFNPDRIDGIKFTHKELFWYQA